MTWNYALFTDRTTDDASAIAQMHHVNDIFMWSLLWLLRDRRLGGHRSVQMRETFRDVKHQTCNMG